MDSYVILAAIVGIPILAAVLFRISAILLFVGTATGILLSQYISEDTTIVFNSLVTQNGSDQYIKLVLLLFPVVLTLIFLRKTISGAQLVVHIIPIVITSVALGSIVMGLLPGGVAHNLSENPFGKIVNSAQNVLIASSAALTLVLALLTSRHHGGRGKRHR